MCNILPLAFLSPCKADQVAKTLIWFEAPAGCNQQPASVLNGILYGRVDLGD